MEYLLILLAVLTITLLLEITHRIHLYHNLKERLTVVGCFFAIGVMWDTIAIIRHHWLFPQGRNLGLIIGVMPLEEYLFILIIPYSILTTYKIIDAKYLRKKKRRRHTKP